MNYIKVLIVTTVLIIIIGLLILFAKAFIFWEHPSIGFNEVIDSFNNIDKVKIRAGGLMYIIFTLFLTLMIYSDEDSDDYYY